VHAVQHGWIYDEHAVATPARHPLASSNRIHTPFNMSSALNAPALETELTIATRRLMQAEENSAPGAYSGLPAAGEEIFGAFHVHFHEFASEIVSYFYNTPSFYVAQLQLLLINILHCKNHSKSSVWTAVCRTVQIGQIRS
jgi:hypothetical protein